MPPKAFPASATTAVARSRSPRSAVHIRESGACTRHRSSTSASRFGAPGDDADGGTALGQASASSAPMPDEAPVTSTFAFVSCMGSVLQQHLPPGRPRFLAEKWKRVLISGMTSVEVPGEPPTALERSQAARRRRVLDATFRLADDGGFDAVQMRDVAAAADVAVGTVYRYFSSKEQLLLEAMAEQQAALLAHLRRNPPSQSTAAERVVSVLRRGERFPSSTPDRDPRRWCERTARVDPSSRSTSIESACS